MNRINRYREPHRTKIINHMEEVKIYRELMAGAVLRGDPVCCKGTGKKYSDEYEVWVTCPICEGEADWNKEKFEADQMAEAEAEYRQKQDTTRISKNILDVDHGVGRIQGTLGEAYFNALGITCDLGTAIGYRNDMAFIDNNIPDRDKRFPAIVYRMRTPSGQLNGRYLCYLSERKEGIRPGYRYVDGPAPFHGNYTILRRLGESETMAVCFSPESGYAWLSMNPSYDGALISTITPQNAQYWERPAQVKKVNIVIDYYADKMAHSIAYGIAHKEELSGVETDVIDPITFVDASRKRETVTFLDALKNGIKP